MATETHPSIHLAAKGDVPRIVDVSNWAAENSPANFATEPEPLSMWITSWEETNEKYPWLVAKHGDDLVGFAKASPHRARGAYAWIAEVSVYIRPDRQGQRIGSRLYGRLIPLLRGQGYVTLRAGITSPNPASERLHAAFGFTRCGTFHRAGWKFGAWHDVGYWELELQSGPAPPRSIRPVREVWDSLRAS
jgi:phosphinothricin acetyltransferase